MLPVGGVEITGEGPGARLAEALKLNRAPGIGIGQLDMAGIITLDEQAKLVRELPIVALHGEGWARQQLAGLVDQAQQLLDVYGERGAMLKAAASFVAARRK